MHCLFSVFHLAPQLEQFRCFIWCLTMFSCILTDGRDLYLHLVDYRGNFLLFIALISYISYIKAQRSLFEIFVLCNCCLMIKICLTRHRFNLRFLHFHIFAFSYWRSGGWAGFDRRLPSNSTISSDVRQLKPPQASADLIMICLLSSHSCCMIGILIVIDCANNIFNE